MGRGARDEEKEGTRNESVTEEKEVHDTRLACRSFSVGRDVEGRYEVSDAREGSYEERDRGSRNERRGTR